MTEIILTFKDTENEETFEWRNWRQKGRISGEIIGIYCIKIFENHFRFVRPIPHCHWHPGMKSRWHLGFALNYSIWIKIFAAQISNLLLKAMGPKTGEASVRWSKAQKTLERLAQQIDRSKQFPGTKVYEKRMWVFVSKL